MTTTPQALVNTLISSLVRRSGNYLTIANNQENTDNKQSLIARAAECQTVIIDLYELLERLNDRD